MSEEQQGGFFSQLKNQVIAGTGVILTGLGGLFMDEVKSFIGIADEEEGGAKTEVVQENNQSQSVNVTGPEIIINIPEQKPAETRTIIKEVPAKKKKEKEEEIDW
jgi:hypothetical protein